MRKLLLILTLLLISNLVTATGFDYIENSASVFQCFGDIEYYERAPARRNLGFDKCVDLFGSQIQQIHCSSLADRYYGPTAKARALQTCINNSGSFDECLSAADYLPSYPARMREALSCLKRHINHISKEQCSRVGFRYNPIKAKANRICQNHFNRKDEIKNQRNDSNILMGTGNTEEEIFQLN